MSSFTTCKYSVLVYEFLIIILKRQTQLLSKTHHSKDFIKIKRRKNANNIHHDDDDETRGRGCRACGATSDGDVHHLASSFFFVLVFDDDSRSLSGEYKRQVEHGIPIEKRNNAKGKRREDKRRASR